jgi:hypothetical protein
LYRGLKDSDKLQTIGDKHFLQFPFLSSWTFEKSMACNFSDKCVKATIPTKDILIDTTLLNPRYIERTLGGFPEELEVIVRQGTYEVKVVQCCQ